MNVFSDRRLIVTLREELEQLDHYIQFLKYVDYRELRVSVHAEPETLVLSVPRLLIQPLIENAYMPAGNRRTMNTLYLQKRKKPFWQGLFGQISSDSNDVLCSKNA